MGVDEVAVVAGVRRLKGVELLEGWGGSLGLKGLGKSGSMMRKSTNCGRD